MLTELECRVGLGFVDAIQGKKRIVRKLAGRIIVFADGNLPVRPHRKDHIDDHDGDPSVGEEPTGIENQSLQAEMLAPPINGNSQEGN